jgi:hypothetical protein
LRRIEAAIIPAAPEVFRLPVRSGNDMQIKALIAG